MDVSQANEYPFIFNEWMIRLGYDMDTSIRFVRGFGVSNLKGRFLRRDGFEMLVVRAWEQDGKGCDETGYCQLDGKKQ